MRSGSVREATKALDGARLTLNLRGRGQAGLPRQKEAALITWGGAGMGSPAENAYMVFPPIDLAGLAHQGLSSRCTQSAPGGLARQKRFGFGSPVGVGGLANGPSNE